MAPGPLIAPSQAHIIDHLGRPAAGVTAHFRAVTYTFGSLCVDGDARRVSRAGGSIHLTRKAFDLLLLLLEHRPNAISKDDIHARLWPDTFVSDGSVQSLVAEIRRSIDGPEPGASWISTVYGIGYRFDGDAVGTPSRPATAPSSRPAAWLLGTSIRIPLASGENVVGRGVDEVADIDAPTMSRQHARIVIGAPTTIEDLDSRNGTWLDDERVTGPRPLRDGARVRLGAVPFTFRLAGPPKPTEPAA